MQASAAPLYWKHFGSQITFCGLVIHFQKNTAHILEMN